MITTRQTRLLPCVLYTLCGSLLIAAPGCSGPTKAGIEARSEARDRMSLVNAQIGLDQAQRAFEVGQFERARREIAISIERSPDQPEFHLLLGRILLEEHRLEPALNAFTRAIDLADKQGWRSSAAHAPTLARAHYFAGIVHQRWSNHQSAHESYMQAAEADRANVQYLLASAESLIALARYDEAIELIESGTHGGRFEHNSALRHLLGQIALLQDDPQRAVTLLSEARLLNPDDILLLEELARAQFAAQMYGRCYESLRLLSRLSTVASRPSAKADSGQRTAKQPATDSQQLRTDLLHMEARCLVMMDRPAEARRVYIELTDLAPGEVEPWIELGSVAYEIGDMRRLAMAASRVAALAPDRWEGLFLKALYEVRMSQELRETGNDGGLDRAVDLLRQAARQAEGGGGSTVPHLVLGRVLEQRGGRGDNDAALAAYAQAKRIDPNDRHAHEFFGSVSSRLTAVPVE